MGEVKSGGGARGLGVGQGLLPEAEQTREQPITK